MNRYLVAFLLLSAPALADPVPSSFTISADLANHTVSCLTLGCSFREQAAIAQEFIAAYREASAPKVTPMPPTVTEKKE